MISVSDQIIYHLIKKIREVKADFFFSPLTLTIKFIFDGIVYKSVQTSSADSSLTICMSHIDSKWNCCNLCIVNQVQFDKI